MLISDGPSAEQEKTKGNKQEKKDALKTSDFLSAAVCSSPSEVELQPSGDGINDLDNVVLLLC